MIYESYKCDADVEAHEVLTTGCPICPEWSTLQASEHYKVWMASVGSLLAGEKTQKAMKAVM